MYSKRAKFNYLEHFSKNTSIHGMQYVGNTKISKLERLIWFLIVIISLCCSYAFIKSNLDHYFANPTVVTIEKDFRNWENPFPATTACYVNKVDPKKAEYYIKKKWGLTRNDTKFEYYMNFIQIVSNLTYKNFFTLHQFKNDDSIVNNNIEWLKLLQEIHPSTPGALIIFPTKIKPKWEFIITELGLCLTLNSRFFELLTPNRTLLTIKNVKATEDDDILRCHFLNGLCYARYDSDPNMPIWYHIHSNIEIIHTTSETPILVNSREEYEVNFKLSETYSLNDIRYLTPNQRKCRFHDEPCTENLRFYSKSLCIMECRYKIAMEKCDCRPFFYPFFRGKLCDLKGLLCISKFTNLFNQSAISGCSCPQVCNLMVYLRQVPKVTLWNAHFFDKRITFRWGLIPPTTKYHRKILFGFQELIVSFGGVLSLFLGISFMSIIETIYLICESIYYKFSLRKK